MATHKVKFSERELRSIFLLVAHTATNSFDEAAKGMTVRDLDSLYIKLLGILNEKGISVPEPHGKFVWEPRQ